MSGELQTGVCSECGSDDLWAWYPAPERQTIDVVIKDGVVAYDYTGDTKYGDAPGGDDGFQCSGCGRYTETIEEMLGLPEPPRQSAIADSHSFNPLSALSLARTALDDPGSLPEGEPDLPEDQLSATQAGLYAVDQIDQVIGALDYNGGSGNDNRGEAAWVARNLASLAETLCDEMRQESEYPDHDEESRLAYLSVSRLAGEAATILAGASDRIESRVTQ